MRIENIEFQIWLFLALILKPSLDDTEEIPVLNDLNKSAANNDDEIMVVAAEAIIMVVKYHMI